MTSAIKILVPLPLALALLAGCRGAAGNDSRSSSAASAEKTSPTPTEAESRKTGYLHTGDESATFIQWAKTDRQIKGQMQVLDLNRDGKTPSRSFSFEGVFDGDNLSLTFRDRNFTFLEGRTVTGTLKGDSLTLVWPQSNGTLWTQELRPASVAEYNDAARKLQERAGKIIAAQEESARRAAAARAEAERIAAEKRAVVEAHSRISDTTEELRHAMQRLCGQGCFKSTLSAYATEWKQMQNEYTILKKEASPPLDSYHLNTVKYHLNGMKYYLNNHDYQRRSFESDAQDADDRVKDVNELIGRLNADWERLRQAVAANTTGEPRSPITAEDISQVVAIARSEINKAVAARDTAKSQAIAYDKQAADLYRQAEAFVKTLKPIDRN